MDGFTLTRGFSSSGKQNVSYSPNELIYYINQNIRNTSPIKFSRAFKNPIEDADSQLCLGYSKLSKFF